MLTTASPHLRMAKKRTGCNVRIRSSCVREFLAETIGERELSYKAAASSNFTLLIQEPSSWSSLERDL